MINEHGNDKNVWSNNLINGFFTLNCNLNKKLYNLQCINTLNSILPNCHIRDSFPFNAFLAADAKINKGFFRNKTLAMNYECIM